MELVATIQLWPKAIDSWLSSPYHFLFGEGFGSFPIVDGTVPYLLANVGLLGFFFFTIVWCVFFLVKYRNNTAVFVLVIFTLINGINAETLIVSYRSVQTYIVLLLFTIFYHFKIKREVLWKKMSLKSPS